MTSGPVHISIISAGSWGTALAIIANRASSKVTLFTRNPHVLESVRDHRTNDAYLPSVFIDPRITITEHLHEVCEADIIVLAVPSQHLRATCISICDLIDTSVTIVIATKGIERGSLALMSDVASAVLPKNPIAIITGPNFAAEAAKGLPTAATIASTDSIIANKVLYAVGGKYFRPYLTDDIIGAQIGGAVKNVIAIACGIALGRGFGENARAALITRGLSEMARLCSAKGGRQETLMGLSGIGDLVLTCSSNTSRNMSFGVEVGRQKDPVSVVIANWQKRLAEGIVSSESVTELARKMGISMPISQSVRDILAEEKDIDTTIKQLLERNFTPELRHTSF